MTTRPHFDADDAKIVPLFTTEEPSESAALARYWDATVHGQPLDTEELDPELKTVVQLLRHYHAVTRHHDANAPVHAPSGELRSPPARAASPPAEHAITGPRRQVPRHHAPLAALTMMGVLILIFVVNTVVSPRSWLLSRASDPDWIPWISDEWLGFIL
jgi:ferric-dicitrate binding protein FerR (iron transport regulator)